MSLFSLLNRKNSQTSREILVKEIEDDIDESFKDKNASTLDLFEGDLSPPGSEFSDEEDNSDQQSTKTSKPTKKIRRKRIKGDDGTYQQGVFSIPQMRQKQFLESGLYCRANDDSDFIFPLPTNFNLWKERDFCVPYDIMFNYFSRKKRFIKIRNNVFVERKRKHDEFPPKCECKPPDDGRGGCLEDCINRLCYIECNPSNCPCGNQCQNQTIQQDKEIEELTVFLTGSSQGFGLKTLVPIPKGRFIIEYKGEVISNDLLNDRIEQGHADSSCIYFLDYSDGEVLDGSMKGNEARFVNHSCEPNCHIEKWHVDGEVAVGIFASRNIEMGEQLTYDYNFHNFGEERIECCCGSSKCRGLVGKSNEFKEKSKRKSTFDEKPISKKRHASCTSIGVTTKDKRKLIVLPYEETGNLVNLCKVRSNFSQIVDFNSKKIKYPVFLVRNFKWIDKKRSQTIRNCAGIIIPKKNLEMCLSYCS